MSPPYFWILDTRPLWPGKTITDAAPDALQVLSQPEADRAKAFHFLKDAKLSVGSSLLKRLFVTRALSTPWQEASFARQGDPKHGKPCHVPAPGAPSTLDFNVSHQAGLVALVGCRVEEAILGVDIACAHERNDMKAIDRSGFDDWVDMHAEAFSDADVAAMKASVTGGDDLEAKVRRFYAYWALKEAYVKLVGEGLLAAWLRSVEFRNVRVPAAAEGEGQQFGEVVGEIEVWQGGKHVSDVELFLQSFEQNHVIATAIRQVRHASVRSVPEYRMIDLERDVYPAARN